MKNHGASFRKKIRIFILKNVRLKLTNVFSFSRLTPVKRIFCCDVRTPSEHHSISTETVCDSDVTDGQNWSLTNSYSLTQVVATVSSVRGQTKHSKISTISFLLFLNSTFKDFLTCQSTKYWILNYLFIL